MFVPDNSLSATQIYFSNQLQGLFSEREVKTMFEALIKQRLNWTSADFLLHHEARLSESDLLFIRSAVKRLLLHEPFQYVIGNTEFYGLSITCAPGALIPRPETEELVDWILEELKGKDSKILDIGTGSGCISLALKKNTINSNVWGLDVSESALNIAKENALSLGIEVRFLSHDILNDHPLEFENHFFDVIVSNPPYIPVNEQVKMDQNVLQFEPHEALFVPDHDPLLFYRVIATKSLSLLKNNGVLFFEIHEDFASQVKDLLAELGFINIELRKDLQGKFRMIKAQRVFLNHE
jgi:release factor glutamine methyltransferase